MHKIKTNEFMLRAERGALHSFCENYVIEDEKNSRKLPEFYSKTVSADKNEMYKFVLSAD